MKKRSESTSIRARSSQTPTLPTALWVRIGFNSLRIPPYQRGYSFALSSAFAYPSDDSWHLRGAAMISLDTKLFFCCFAAQHPQQQHHNARPRILLCLNNTSKILQHLSLEERRLTICSETLTPIRLSFSPLHALHASLHHHPAATMRAFLFGAAFVSAFAWAAFRKAQHTRPLVFV